MRTLLTSKNSEFDEWSILETVNSFDADPTQLMDEVEGGGLLLQDVNRFSSLSLLVESLIDQLCKLMETDVARQKSLYLAICNKLFKMKLIDQTYDIEEFQFVRCHYQKALFQLFSVAKTSTVGGESGNSSLLPVSSTNSLTSSIFLKHQLLDLSRYHTEYEELEYIAEGGFGRVHRARNILDGGEYAIKKICLRYRNVSGFLRSLQEVKMLAQLNHPNIVAYKAAWLEKYSPPNAPVIGAGVNEEELASFLASQSRKSRPKVVIGSYSEEGSIVFRNSNSDEKPSLSCTKEAHEESSVINLESVFQETCVERTSVRYESYKSEVCETVSSTHRDARRSEPSEDGESSSLEDRALCEYRGIPVPDNAMRGLWKFDYEPREWATLYVQMQLCEGTLRQWLDKRNAAGAAVDVRLCLATFRQVVLGIEYIHSRGIVHHDVKPSNIFVDGRARLAQVGDFGLACCLQHSAPGLETFVPDALGTQHWGEIGTKLYAAPEQLSGECNAQSDIYSLGIVLFELMQPFSTEMERSKIIARLKTGHIPAQLSALSPQLVQLIKRLVSHLPNNRPTASELRALVDELLQEMSSSSQTEKSKDETIAELRRVIAEKDREIAELKERLQAKQDQLPATSSR